MDDYDQHAFWLAFNLGARLARHQAGLSLSAEDSSLFRSELIHLLAQIRDGDLTLMDPENVGADEMLNKAYTLAMESEKEIASRVLGNYFDREDELLRVTNEVMDERAREERERNQPESEG